MWLAGVHPRPCCFPSVIRAGQWAVSDFEEGPFSFSEDRPPQIGVLTAGGVELIRQEPDNRFQGHSASGEMNPLHGDAIRQTILREVAPDLYVCRRVRIRRSAEVVVPEDPAIPLPIYLVLVAGGLNFEPVVLCGGADVELKRQPEKAAIRERQRIVWPTPSANDRVCSSSWPIAQSDPTFRRKNGEMQKETGKVPEGISGFQTASFVGFSEPAGLRKDGARSGRDKERVALSEEAGEGDEIRHQSGVLKTPRAICLDQFAGGHVQPTLGAALDAPNNLVAGQFEDTIGCHFGHSVAAPPHRWLPASFFQASVSGPSVGLTHRTVL